MRYLSAIVTVSLLVIAMPAVAQVRDDAPPRPPAGAAPNLVLPPVGDDGSFDTPNRRLTPAEAVWHMRAALNVAALGCRGVEGDAIVAGYNQMLRQHAVALAAANNSVDGAYRVRYGARWQGARETDMTRTYNFFAQPPAQADFCPIAAGVLAEVADVASADLPAFAAARMQVLEAPFQNFYARYAAYRVAMTAWQQRTPPVVLATVAAVPMAPPTAPR